MTMNQTPDRAQRPGRFRLLRVPLFRLLAINLAVGVTLAAVAVGGLLALNPGGLRHLIFADASPGTALGLLLFGFVVTFGSAAMGTAIMAMGRAADDEKRRGPPAPVAQPAHAMARQGAPTEGLTARNTRLPPIRLIRVNIATRRFS
jgi:hypothetical protein